MEESEKRRERLQSQRMDSASPAPCSPYSSPPPPPPVHLSNPLSPRFDLYTDPTPAFSGSMRSSGGGGYNLPENFSSPIRSAASPISHPSSYQPSAGPRSYHMAAPANQFQVNQPLRHCSYGTPPPVPGSASWRSPVPFASPLSGPGVSPIANPGCGGSSRHGFPPSSSRAGFMSPGFGRVGSPMSISSSMSPGIGGGGSPMSYSGGSGPHNFSGWGRGWRGGRSPSPSPGRTSGRGARQEAERFYGKYMVEDPWRGMRPIVGNILVPLAGQDFWLPKSITAKKAKITESVEEFNSHLSLAECLALSFEEAVTDPNV